MNLDYFIFQQINQFAGRWPIIDAIAIFIATKLEYLLLACLVFYFIKDYRKYTPIIIKAIGAAIVSRFVIVEVVRQLYYRPRPFLVHNVNLLVRYGNEPSFPSGHASFYFAIATVVYMYNKKTGIAFFAASFFIVLARVFVGIHWPSDILAGAIIGIIVGYLAARLNREAFSFGGTQPPL